MDSKAHGKTLWPVGALVSCNVIGCVLAGVFVKIGVHVTRSAERSKMCAQFARGVNWNAKPFVMVWMFNCGGNDLRHDKGRKIRDARDEDFVVRRIEGERLRSPICAVPLIHAQVAAAASVIVARAQADARDIIHGVGSAHRFQGDLICAGHNADDRRERRKFAQANRADFGDGAHGIKIDGDEIPA